jgi:uncharacterized protein YbjT (DUF2867 family)
MNAPTAPSSDITSPDSSRILVTGSTGYIGGRLIPLLLERGYRVRALVRSEKKARNRPWSTHPNLEIFVGNVLDHASLVEACRGCGAGYYLVHSMLPGTRDYRHSDLEAAKTMRDAAAEAGLGRIIYLGGLGEDRTDLSEHLKSRREVERMLQSGKTPVTILRAAMIIGSGSASFEILRYLVDRLPCMITPKWVHTPSQPIAVRNVLEYLAGCLAQPSTAGERFDIGGPDVVTYEELMRVYAEEAGLPKRWIVPVPVLTPRLSSYWIHLVTPVPATIARPLAEGLKNPVVCQENRIRAIIPQHLIPVREAIRLAIQKTLSDEVVTRWTDAGGSGEVEAIAPGDPEWAGGTLLRDERSLVTSVDPARLWSVIESIGGTTGWYHADFLWRLRGIMDRLFGGVGLRRGRRNAHELLPGDALDFWRVIDCQKGRRLSLRAEMKLPGEAVLQFEIQPQPDGSVRFCQRALFRPKGLWGLLYWALVSPLHAYVFGGMLSKIVRRAAEPAKS